VVCNGVAVSVTGNFNATLQTQIPAGGSSADMADTIRRALREALR
jgi:hypothetical protein